ncbi:NAD(P)H:quinone oxidoreductase [Egicoccus halophilus]|uniref:Flavoprotein n=1 Tax=Egicoccus halophilus TaxID=1670830 RepID=A0A8J3A7W6_9ACTN|nr:NAD(P)H:quinone oxidoreductase [Egicoccus halophilus]GGI03419.1 flavoprotein [Egicoccus halophilus]
MARIGIVYHSMYGSTHDLATILAEGVEKAGGEAHLRRVPDPLLPDEVKQMDGVAAAIDKQQDVTEATVEELPEFDAILFGSPTRYGSNTAQLQNFWDQTGALWSEGGLVGKPAGFFTGAATIHGGHETTILSMSTFAYHHGMVIVPVGYGLAEEVGSTRTGGSPYGPTHWSPMGGDKQGIDDDEREIALKYAAHFNQVADKLAA